MGEIYTKGHNIKIYIKEMRCEDVNWTHQAQYTDQ